MARFDTVKATFWGESPHGVQPALTDAVVQDAEHRLGVRLPAGADFRAFVERLTASASFDDADGSRSVS